LLYGCGILDEKYGRFYFKKLIEAVQHIHNQKIFHRDIKPLNILIQNDDHIVKLADFGHSIEADEPELPGNVFGTQSYQALDVKNPEGYAMAPLDVFSCGVVLIAMLTGFEPFFRLSANDLYDNIKE
jgi:serine/threonine protein kinase